MAPLQPVALFGLKVPAGDILVPVSQGFPATIRLTMAAIDPTEEIEDDGTTPRLPRSTLKLVKQTVGGMDDENSDDEDAYLRDLLLGDGDDSEEDDDDETNGGPSDPAKSKKARQAAALQKLLEATKDDESDEEMEDADKKPKAKKSSKGKEVATEDDEDEEDEDDEDEESDDELAGLDLEPFVVCTLDTERHYQQTLEITVGEGEKAFFVNSGTHTIYVTGNYVINEDTASDSDCDSCEDEDEYDLPPDFDELVGEDGESEDELDGIDGTARVEEVDTDEEVAPKLVEAKKGKNKRPAEDEAGGLDDLIAKDIKSADAKLSKKQAKKLKNNEGKAVTAAAEKAAQKDAAKAEKKVQFAKNLEQGPTGSTAEKPKQADKKLSVKVVQGVTIDDRKVGTGRTAKKGDKVGMRYIGKLDNGREFDANKKGPPFSFKLGKGEVIKGWDIGVDGMRVGGERRLVIPAHLAYGSKKLAGIPPNSTLTFDVKLLEVK